MAVSQTQRADVDVDGQQAAHQGLGVVCHETGRALAEQPAERAAHRAVAQELPRQPHRSGRPAGFARAGLRRWTGGTPVRTDERQAFEVRPAAPAAPRPRNGQRTALRQAGDARHGARGVAGLLHGDLEHLDLCARTELQSQRLPQPLQERAELQELEQSQDLLGARGRHGQVVDRHGQVQVAAQLHEFAVEANGLLRLLQRRPQLRAQLVEGVVDAVDAAVATDEPRRRLLSPLPAPRAGCPRCRPAAPRRPRSRRAAHRCVPRRPPRRSAGGPTCPGGGTAPSRADRRRVGRRPGHR